MSSRTAFVVAVLVASLPLPIQAHDIYSHLRDEGGGSCCDNQDCRPALYRFTARGVQMFVDQQWINVPNERIQYRALLGDAGETYGALVRLVLPARCHPAGRDTAYDEMRDPAASSCVGTIESESRRNPEMALSVQS
ncbi:hypothetical protein BB934_35955 (plasmid) [Microvirga ossetica]|uniref:Uncharacterized protein n=1 Tax=Microvirga ossetica TaxID=1882682 RepID=A0A1B2EUK4_9HYPH|nr:hypothetical protein [Microvirga ossetica]ANY83649.1 hypothetical protein BB934_35955 [Microvirga ossetica]